MSSSRNTTVVYYERKVRDDEEIQTMLYEGSDDDDGNDEEDPPPSNVRWVVQKSSKSPFSKAVRLTKCNVDERTTSKTKENGKVSPLKIKRKLSYSANKADSSTKRPDIVSPILIKRIPECHILTNASSSVGYNKLHTIDLLSSEDDETTTKRDRKNKNDSRSETKKRMSKPTKESKTPQSKKPSILSDPDDNGFELTTRSKLRKSVRKIEVDTDDDDDSWLVKKEVSTPKTKLQRKTPREKHRVEPSDDQIQTPSKVLQKRLSDEMKTDTEETKMDCTPSKRRKQVIIPRSDPDEALLMILPLSSRVNKNNKENVGSKTPEKSFESKVKSTEKWIVSPPLSRVFVALDRLSVGELSESSLRESMHSAMGSATQNKRCPTKKTPSKSEALRSAVALSRADTTPIKGVTPGKEEEAVSYMTPSKGTTPSKSPAKPSQRKIPTEDKDDPARPSRTSRARKAVTSSEEEDEPSLPSRTSRTSRARKAVTSSEEEDEPSLPSRTSRTSRARKAVTSSEEEDEPSLPSRTSGTRKSKANTSSLKSPTDSPARSLRHRDQIKKVERYTASISTPRNNVNSTPRRSARFSMSPSTPSLRQKVLMANTPRSSLPPVMDGDESEEEFVTPRKTPKSAKKKLEMTPTTPLSTRKVGHGFLSPVVADRGGGGPATPSSALGIARAQLQVSTLPTSLPCREKEFNDIKSFIFRKIHDGTGGCMYISGVPGTGKTATVHTVVRTLQKMAEDDEITKFDFVEVNGLRMTEPRQAYVRIWQILSKNKVTPDQALKHLETKFLGKPKRCTVLLIDELDYLCNRRQDVIYNILDWTTKRYAKFIVLAIANTMDLPERTLKGKVTSRMGLTRLVFQPYTYQQLEEIVLDRLDGCKAFHADAVQLVARKVAAVSGDARRALDICRRSTEILELEGRSSVSVLDIQKVLSQIFAGSRVQAIKNCSLMAKLVLRAIRDEVLRTGIEETTVAFVHPQIVSVCALEGKRMPAVTDILRICSNLADSGLIFAEKGRKDINRKISLNISTDDIHYAIDF